MSLPTGTLVQNPSLLAAVAAVVIVGWYARRHSGSKNGLPLPPGPTPGWFWESFVPLKNMGFVVDELVKQHGPVITIQLGGQNMVIIGRVEAATELMEKEGSALVDRPTMIAADELLSDGKRLVLVGSGDRFRRLRKAVHTHLQAKVVETYKEIQFDNAKTFILDVLNDPKKHQKHAERYTTSVVLRVTYGKSSPTSIDDPDFVGVRQVIEDFMIALRPGSYLVDLLPWLRYVPGYTRTLRKQYEYALEFYLNQLNRVRNAVSSNDAGPSFTRTLLEKVDDHQLSVEEMSFLSGQLFEAGSDTTACGIMTMIMAAAKYPEAQRRVQEELNMVVGMDKLPSWDDWDALPQVHAFIAEVLRWRPIAPNAVPHRATRDIIWRGYCIPAGTTVFGNLWAIGRDPEVFPDPEKFDPQRWIDKDGKLRDDLRTYTFGFGRRVCPGIHLANRSLFISLSFLLWSFKIVERPDAPVDTTPDTDSPVVHPAYFEVDFVPRLGEERLREMMSL